jgi:hypothetical protein
MSSRADVELAAVAAVLLCSGIAAAQDKGDKSDDKKQCMVAAETGQNQRDDGHYRAARESFLACTRDACPKVVVQSCTRWLRELDQDAPTVVLGAKDEQGNDLTDVKVTYDGEPLATVLDGKPIGTDSGEHVFRFEREGSVPVEQKLVLRAGEKARVVTAVLRSENAAAAPPEPEPSKPPPPAAETQPPESLLSAHNVTAGVIGIGALAAAGVGALFLVESEQAKNDANNLRSGLAPSACSRSQPPSTCQSLSDKVNAQHNDANLATGLFIGAGALAAAAVLTWIVWPHGGTEPTSSAWIAPVPGGVTLNFRGHFE